MSKGRRKPNLRDYSHLVLSDQERQAVQAALRTDQHPIVTAVLGYVMVEYELDQQLRRKLRKKDDDTWQELVDERGPLRTFATKIILGRALALYSEKVRYDLNIVRVIRNAFAHSKKLLDFNDVLIIPELMKAHCLPATFKKYLHREPAPALGKAAYIMICLSLSVTLLRLGTRALRAKNYRFRRKYPHLQGLASALGVGLPAPRGILGLAALGSALGSNPPQYRASQSDYPKQSPPSGLLEQLIRQRPNPDDNKDK
jgi:hypothetical protein